MSIINLEISSNEKNQKNIKKNNNIIIVLCFSIITSLLLYHKVRYLNSIIIEKDNEIKRQKSEINFLKIKGNISQKKNIIINKELKDSILNEYLYDYNHYKSNNMNYSNALNRLEYSIVITSHTLEKGFSHFKLRPFGVKKINKMIHLLKKEIKYRRHKKLFSFINAINLLKEYKKTYEVNNWNNSDEYIKVSIFLKNHDKIEKKKLEHI